MKRLTLILVLTLTASALWAQKGKVNKAKNYADYGNFEAAFPEIDELTKDEEAKSLAYTWLGKAYVYMKAYEYPTEKLVPGTEKTLFLLNKTGEYKETVEGDLQHLQYEHVKVTFKKNPANGKSYLHDFEVTKPYHENPLPIAYTSLHKALKFDAKGDAKGKKKGKYKEDIYEEFGRLSGFYKNKAIGFYSSGKFLKAFEQLDTALAIDQMDNINKLDTIWVYYGGLAAMMAGNGIKAEATKDTTKTEEQIIAAAAPYYKKGTQWLGKVLELDYQIKDDSGKVVVSETAQIFGYLSSCYAGLGQEDKAFETLDKGLARYPEDQTLMLFMIDYYHKNDQPEKAIEYLNKAISSDQDNVQLYFFKAMMYEKMKDKENAIKIYQKALEKDPMFADAAYNLGVLYFTAYTELQKEADEIPTNKPEEFKAKTEEAKAELAKAQKYMEKAHEINPKDHYYVRGLKEVYANQNKMDKAKEMDELYKKLTSGGQ